MEEDVLGTREEALGDEYTNCTRCGRPFPRRQARLAPDDSPEVTLSAQAELCPECRRERDLGDERVR